MKVPGSKKALCHGVLCSNHRNTLKIFKTLLIQSQLAQMLETWHVAMPNGLFQVCSNRGPSLKDGPGARFKQYKYIKNIEKSSSSTCLRCLKFGMCHCLVVLYQVYSNKGLRNQISPATMGLGF